MTSNVIYTKKSNENNNFSQLLTVFSGIRACHNTVDVRNDLTAAHKTTIYTTTCKSDDSAAIVRKFNKGSFTLIRIYYAIFHNKIHRQSL